MQTCSVYAAAHLLMEMKKAAPLEGKRSLLLGRTGLGRMVPRWHSSAG